MIRTYVHTHIYSLGLASKAGGFDGSKVLPVDLLVMEVALSRVGEGL